MRRPTLIIGSAVVAAAALAAIAIVGSTAPSMPRPVVVDIPEGSTLNEIAMTLKADGVIRSELLFRAYATMLDGTSGAKSGEYLFAEPQSALAVAQRLVRGDEGFPKEKVTIPEGSTGNDIAAIVSRAIPALDEARLRSLARTNEGYLFPETYFWTTNATPEEIVSDMRAMFDEKTASLKADATSTGHAWKDIVTLASIVEKEASSTADRRVVAGILWNRLKLGMPLQADASFYYAIGTTSRALTEKDLTMKSPYNLYAHAGLPPTPIANPGLDALEAAAFPASTKYLYYLSGTDGTMHYATTLDQHNRNKAKYLN